MSKAEKDTNDAPKADAPDATQAANEQTPEVATESPLQLAEAELAVTKDRLLRLQADFDNFRRRTQREKSEWSIGANEKIIQALLPALDHFELGLKTSLDQKADKSVHDGFQMIYDQILGSLKSFGLAPLDVHESGFDPVHHEAVAHIPSDEYPADEIIQQTRRGWKLGDKLLRPVQVIISSGPGASRGDGDEKSDAPKAGG